MSIRTRLPASPSAASHNTPPASSHEPLASTARRHPGRPLALLMMLSLAACGGSGSDDAGQSAQLTQKAETPVLSSNPSSTTSGTENTTPSTAAAANTTPASDASTASTPSTSTSTTEASAATTPAATPAATADAALAAVPSELVDDKEIRSDVVMAALVGHATGAAQGNAQDATRELIPTEKGGIELTKPKLASEDPQPLLKLDVGIQPSTDSSFQQPFTYRAHAEAQPGQTGKAAFNAATWEQGLSSNQFAAGQTVTIGNVLRFTQAGLNEGKPIVLNSVISWGRPDNSVTQFSAEKRIYRNGSFKEWESEDKEYRAELDMSSLDGPDTFLLTLNVFKAGGSESMEIRSAWRIPANWKSGDALVKLGEQVVHETRSPAYNGDGVLSGTSSSTDTWSTANYRAEGIVDGTTDVPLNERGISGALLSASFDSLPDEDYGFNDDNGRLQAASSPTGAFIDKAPDPDSLKLWENSQADNFGPRPAADNYVPAEGTYYHELKAGVGNWYNATPSFEHLEMSLKLRAGTQSGKQVIFLPNELKTYIDVPPADKPDDHSPSNRIEGVLASVDGQKGFHHDSLVPFGTLMTWQGQKDGKPLTVKMSLKPGPEANQVTRCWTAALPSRTRDLNRDICSTFVVPSGWQHGQALERVSSYVTDTRPGDNGQPVTRTWRSNPAAPK
mgnify:CR=1 FL=1